MNCTSVLWGIFALGMVPCVLGSVPWKAAGLCQCCCPGFVTVPVTCCPCSDAAACTGFQTLYFATSWGRNTLTEDISDSLTLEQLQGGPFFAPFAAAGRVCARASPSIPIPVVSAPPLQDLCSLGRMPKPINCSPELCILIPLKFLSCPASPFRSQRSRCVLNSGMLPPGEDSVSKGGQTDPRAGTGAWQGCPGESPVSCQLLPPASPVLPVRCHIPNVPYGAEALLVPFLG